MHSRTLLRRLAGATVALMLLTSLFTGTALAKPPAYQPNPAPPDSVILAGTPAFVTWGGQVRFDVYFTNTSGANLPSVNMKAETAEGAELVALLAGDQAGSCAADPPSLLTCAFGTVNDGDTVRFSVVYKVPSSGSSFSQTFIFTAQGATGSDTPKKSRGDDMPVVASVALVSSSDDRAGGYIFGSADTVQNNPTLSKQRNPQNAKLDFSDSGEDNFGATVREQATTVCAPNITTCYGDFIIMEVADGNPISGGFLVTAGYFQVPGTAAGGFVHWLVDDPSSVEVPIEGIHFELIDETCLDTGGAMPCLEEIRKTNGNTFYDVLMDENGPMRGY